MNKDNLIFKIFTISILCVNIVFLVYFLPQIINVVNKSITFSSVHLVLLICVIALNVLYLGFIIFKLIKNKNIKNSKIKKLKIQN